MLVSEVMKKDVVKVKLGTSLEEVALKLFSHQISGLLVVDENDKLVGIISEKDVYRMFYPKYEDVYKTPEAALDYEAMESRAKEVKDKKVEEFMIKEVETLKPTDPVMKAGAIMLIKKINRLPVVEDGKVVGIVSRRDIYQEVMRTELGIEIKPEYEIKYKKKGGLGERIKEAFARKDED